MIATGLRSRIAFVLLCGGALLLAGCSASSPKGPPTAASSSTPAGSSPPSPGASDGRSTTSPTVEQRTLQILGGGGARTPQLRAAGDLIVNSAKVPAIAEILEVRAGAKGTLLRWQLRSASGGRAASRGFSLSKPPLFDTRGVRLRDNEGKRVLSPFTYVPQKNDNDTGCVCSEVPSVIGADPQPMYALYPALSASTTTVDVILPGFAVAKGARVER